MEEDPDEIILPSKPQVRRQPSKEDVARLVVTSDNITLIRTEFKKNVDNHFGWNLAEWLSGIQEIQVDSSDLITDLRDGVVLCNVLLQLPEAGIAAKDFHPNPTNELQRLENLALFRTVALQKLSFPSCFKVEEFNDRNPTVIAALLFLAKSCSKHEQLVKPMPEDLRDHVKAMPKLDEVPPSCWESFTEKVKELVGWNTQPPVTPTPV